MTRSTRTSSDEITIPVHSCGPGWNQLVQDMAECSARIDPSCSIASIRERWGLLEVELKPSAPEFAAELVELSEAIRTRSAHVCEVSGRPGVLMVSEIGWFRTLDPLSAPLGWDVVERPPHVSDPSLLHLLRVMANMHRARGRS